MTMYNAIIAAVNQAADYHTEIEFVIPSGTAIQNARTTFLGDNFNRDGYHLDLGIGRYTAACTWLEALTGVSPVGMTYRPQSVDALMATVAQNAAHYAILAPSQVTDMSTVGYSADNVITPSDVVKVNFGETVVTAAGWNSITPNGRVITSLEDVSGNATEITIILNDVFNGTNELGLTSTATVLNMPDDVSKTCLWGYAEGTFGTQSPQSSGGFSFCHLNKDLAYDFTFFGSRKNCNDNRETAYTLTGANTRVGYLDGANNSTNTVTVRGVRPDQNGQITLTVTPGANNTNTNKFYYINAMQIEGYAPTAAISLSSPYTGTALAQGDFYLYNVASGLWLQNNDSRTNFWHTMGDIGKRGIDFTLTANGDGYYICGKLTEVAGKGMTINRDNMYIDTDATHVWKIEPVTVDGTPNAYRIYSDSYVLSCTQQMASYPAYGLFSKGAGQQYYLVSSANPSDEDAVWQLVTKAERLAKLSEASATNPVDASWLIPTPDFPNNDTRYALWTKNYDGGEFIRGCDVAGDLGRGSMIISSIGSTYSDMYTTLTDLPNGRYTLQLQGFYRDGSHAEIGSKRDAGDEMLRAVYYANNVQQNIMSICDNIPAAKLGNYYAWQSGSYWIPNNSDRPSAQRCMQLGMRDGYGYVNEPLEVIVDNQQLTVGVKKGSMSTGDWLVFDNFKLTYYGPVTYTSTQKTVGLTNGYATFCSDRNMRVATTGAAAYKVSATPTTGGVTAAVLTPIDYIPAYTGVIIYGDGLSEAVLESVDNPSTTVDVSDNMLRPSLNAHQLMTEEYYGSDRIYNYTLGVNGTDVSFKHSTGKGLLAAGRAYLQSGVNVADGASTARIILSFDVATGIGEIRGSSSSPDTRPSSLYDLQGRRVEGDATLKTGIYIQNGKKHIIKQE